MSRSLQFGSSNRRHSASDTGRRVHLIVAAIAVTSLAVAIVTGVTPFPAGLAVAVMVPAAVIDLEQRRLPDAWVGGALVTLMLALAVGSAIGHEIELAAVAGGALAMGGAVLALHLVSPDAMGFGDVKAALVLGAAVGTVDWRLGVVALCLAALTGAAVGVLARQRTIAFGPFLVVGALIVLIASDPIGSWMFTDGRPR